MKIKLDKEELEILESYDRGEWKSVKNVDKEVLKLQKAAKNTLSKQYRVNISLPKYDLDSIRLKAVEEGVSYQALISSILHKYALGRLVNSRK